jgi:hypothetical protein
MTYPATKTSEFNRTVPLVSLLLTIGAIIAHHQYAMSAGAIYPWIFLFLSMFGGLAAAGAVYPPLFYSLGKYGKHLPMHLKVIAATCALGTFAAGLYVMISVYQ